MDNQKTAEKLKELAKKIRFSLGCNEEIAAGFELIASAMEPCVDCMARPLDSLTATVLDHEKLPESGMDNATDNANVEAE